jgi:hypothetical protein
MATDSERELTLPQERVDDADRRDGEDDQLPEDGGFVRLGLPGVEPDEQGS